MVPVVPLTALEGEMCRDVQRCAEMCRDVQIESEKSIKSYQNDMKRTAGCATLASPEVGCRYLCNAFAEWRREGANSFPYFSRSLAALVETNGKDARWQLPWYCAFAYKSYKSSIVNVIIACSRSSCQEEMLASSGFITTPRTQAAAQTLFSVSLAGNDLFKTDILRVHYTSCLDAMQLGLESAAFHTEIEAGKTFHCEWFTTWQAQESKSFVGTRYIVPGRDYAYHVPTREPGSIWIWAFLPISCIHMVEGHRSILSCWVRIQKGGLVMALCMLWLQFAVVVSTTKEFKLIKAGSRMVEKIP